MKKLVVFKIVVFLILVSVQSVNAEMVPMISGSISTTDGTMCATGAWSRDAGTTLTWNISGNGSYYTYKYEFIVPISETNQVKDLSHIIFEVSDNFSSDNYLNSSISTYDELGSFSSDNGNPDMPRAFANGLKFEGKYLSVSQDDETKTFTISFDSDRVPIYGDFYAKDGCEKILAAVIPSCGIDIVAWNSGFGDHKGAKIVVPDTNVVPVPAALVLGVLGITIAGVKLRKYT